MAKVECYQALPTLFLLLLLLAVVSSTPTTQTEEPPDGVTTTSHDALSRRGFAKADDKETGGDEVERRTLRLAVFSDPTLLHLLAAHRPLHPPTAAHRYITALVSAVENLLQQGLSSAGELRLQLVQVGVWAEAEALPFRTEGSSGSILRSFCQWVSQRRPARGRLGHWHHAIFLSGRDLFETTPSPLGTTYVGGLCHPRSSCSVVEARSFKAVHVATHELAHSMGVPHDGAPEASQCPKDGFLMGQSLTHTSFRWSNCSTDALAAILTRNSCLEEGGTDSLAGFGGLNHNTGQMPGQMYPADDQCRLALGREYRATPSKMSICEYLTCTDGLRTQGVHPALEGTSCGNGRFCISGSCRSHELPARPTPTVPPTVPPTRTPGFPSDLGPPGVSVFPPAIIPVEVGDVPMPLRCSLLPPFLHAFVGCSSSPLASPQELGSSVSRPQEQGSSSVSSPQVNGAFPVSSPQVNGSFSVSSPQENGSSSVSSPQEDDSFVSSPQEQSSSPTVPHEARSLVPDSGLMNAIADAEGAADPLTPLPLSLVTQPPSTISLNAVPASTSRRIPPVGRLNHTEEPPFAEVSLSGFNVSGSGLRFSLPVRFLEAWFESLLPTEDQQQAFLKEGSGQEPILASTAPTHTRAARTSSCSSPCGGGTRLVTQVCVEVTEPEREVSETLCDGLPNYEAPFNQSCNTFPCASPRWLVGSWGECSAWCGVGLRRRLVVCGLPLLQEVPPLSAGYYLPHSRCSGEPVPKSVNLCSGPCLPVDCSLPENLLHPACYDILQDIPLEQDHTP